MLHAHAVMLAGSIWDRITEWHQDSVFRELIAYFDQTYFSVSLGEYQHFSVSARTGAVVKNLILGIALGMIVAAIVSCYVKTVHGGFIRKLLKEECLSPETAKSLYTLGYFHDPSVRKQLTRGSAFGGLVHIAAEKTEAEAQTEAAGEPAPEAPAFATARFYIPEDLKYQAELRYEKKGSGVRSVILTAVIVVIAAALICRFLPQLLGFADLILGIFS